MTMQENTAPDFPIISLAQKIEWEHRKHLKELIKSIAEVYDFKVGYFLKL